MSTAASPLPAGTVTAAIQAVVRDFEAGRVSGGRVSGGLVAVEKAKEIFDWFYRRDPNALNDFMEEHVIALIARQISVAIAYERRDRRTSVFAGKDGDRLKPFSQGVSTEGRVWKQVGKTVKRDWEYMADDERRNRTLPSIFNLKLAQRMVTAFPDEITPLEKVMSPEQYEKIELKCQQEAEKLAARIK